MNTDPFIEEKMKEAESEFLNGHYDRTIELCDSVTGQNPEYDKSCILRLKSLAKTLPPDLLLAEAEKAGGQFPRSTDLWMLVGSLFSQHKQVEKAISSYRRSIALDPRNFKSTHNLGVILLNTGEESEGVLLLERAIVIKPDYRVGIGSLIQVYHQMGRYEDVIRCGDALPDMMREDIGIRGLYGDALYHMKDYLRARTVFSSLIHERKRGLILFSLFCPVVTDADRYNHQGTSGGDADYIAATYYRAFTGLPDEKGVSELISLSLLHEVLAENPDHVYALAALSLVSKMVGRDDEALQYIQDAITREPGNDHLLKMKAFLIIGNNPQESLSLFEEIMRQDPADICAESGSAWALKCMGREKEADQILSAIQERDPVFFSDLSRIIGHDPSAGDSCHESCHDSGHDCCHDHE